ncbi:MAG: hypothetical protein ABSC46_13085 [Candidatus Limnocylindrales bacterium]
MRPELRVLDGGRPGRAAPRPSARRSVDRLELAGDRLAILARLLRTTGRPAEGLAAAHVRDLVLSIAGDIAESRVGTA